MKKGNLSKKEELLTTLNTLKKSHLKTRIDKRILEFKHIDKTSNDAIFQELCFCILTANYTAEKTIEIQKNIGTCFLNPSQQTVSLKLKECGYRFPNIRAEYICSSVHHKQNLSEILSSYTGEKLREWFVTHIKGLGYKESSHFLRNIGFDDYAIIDFHIVDLLVNFNYISRPKTMTKKTYITIENILRSIAEQTGLTLGELDLYLWYIETGKILK